MYGYINGLTDTDDINYCPSCGEAVHVYHSDGTASCYECGKRFGVVEVEESGAADDCNKNKNTSAN